MMIDRRAFLGSSGGAALSALAACASVPKGSGASAAEETRALYDLAFEKVLETSPELATEFGLDTGSRVPLRSRLSDLSPAGKLRSYQALVDLLPRFRRIDRSNLPLQERVWLETFIWQAERAAEIGRFGFGRIATGYPVPFPVSQLSGSYLEVPGFLLRGHKIASGPDAEAYLARVEQFAEGLRQETQQLRRDSARGIAPPPFIIDKTLTQLQSVRVHAPADGELLKYLVRSTGEAKIGGDWQRRGARLIEARVTPALDEQIAVLTELRKLNGSGRLSDLPDGEAYFEACLRFHTSTNQTADEIHRIGLAQTDELKAELEILLRKEGLTNGTIGARLAELGSQERHLYPNDEAGRSRLLSDLEAQLEPIRRRLGDFFGRVPEAQVEIKRVPPEIELGAPRGYAIMPGDGRPGGYYINLADTRIWPRWALQTLTYHESLPGHIFQHSIALANSGIPRLHQIVYMGAFSEGWGLYAEQLADEMGIYQRLPIGRVGFLQSLLHRSARLAAETGLHSKGWSRSQSIRHLIDTVGIRESLAENETDRYVVWPGQGATYKIGHNEFVRLRERARSRLGSRFDVKSFHDAVLANGSMPLVSLDAVVSAWTEERIGS